MRVATLNARSVKNKVVSICNFLSENKIVACGLTETWLTDKEQIVEREFKELGFYILHNPRKKKKGGGVGFLYKSELIAKKCKSKKTKSFELLEVTLKGSKKMFMFSTIYRTGSLNISERDEFLEEMEIYISMLSKRKEFVIIWGDFNIHVEKKHEKLAVNFLELMETHGFKQLVQTPTHIAGGILDLIFVNDKTDSCKVDVFNERSGLQLSDHFTVQLSLPDEPVSQNTKINYTFRSTSHINIPSFSTDLHHELLKLKSTDLNSKVNHFMNSISATVNKHAPIQHRSKLQMPKIFRHKSIAIAKQNKRKAERRFRKTMDDGDRHVLNQASRNLVKVVKKTRNEFYQEKLNTAKGDSKGTWKVINHLLNKNKEKLLPDYCSKLQLADDFEFYFKNKIDKLSKEIKSNGNYSNYNSTIVPKKVDAESITFSKFELVSSEELKVVFKSIKNKYSSVDDTPTILFQPILNSSLKFILEIVNQSLKEGIFPQALKTSHVLPIAKKGASDYNLLSVYRPVSNIPFMSKVIEKCGLTQLYHHLQSFNLLISKQSAYRANHSCETALLKVYDDILTTLDTDTSIILVLLDFSSAFDTIDHDLMLIKLKNDFGMQDTAINWFKSYLNNRCFRVKIDDFLSKGESVMFGIPQGSILGPVLFTLYTQEVGKIIESHGLKFHMFADDIQIYHHYSGSMSQLSTIKACLHDVKCWAKMNHLKLNDNKTKFINVALKSFKHDLVNIQLFNETIPVELQAKSLGFIFDKRLSLCDQITSVRKVGYYMLGNLWRVSSSLNIPLKTQLVHSCVLAHIDYCNSLYYGLPNNQIKRLQLLMNAAVRFIHNIRNTNTSITPFLKKSHLLPVHLRIRFKICVTVFKCLNGTAPDYLSNLITKKVSLQSLRVHEDKTLLHQPSFESSHRNRRFSITGPKLWNELPKSLRTITSIMEFKSKLKTFLFEQF